MANHNQIMGCSTHEDMTSTGPCLRGGHGDEGHGALAAEGLVRPGAHAADELDRPDAVIGHQDAAQHSTWADTRSSHENARTYRSAIVKTANIMRVTVTTFCELTKCEHYGASANLGSCGRIPHAGRGKWARVKINTCVWAGPRPAQSLSRPAVL